MTRNHFCSGERCDPTPVNTAYGPARARPRLARRLARVRPSPGLVARPGAPLLLRVTCSPASGAGDAAGLGRPSRALQAACTTAAVATAPAGSRRQRHPGQGTLLAH